MWKWLQMRTARQESFGGVGGRAEGAAERDSAEERWDLLGSRPQPRKAPRCGRPRSPTTSPRHGRGLRNLVGQQENLCGAGGFTQHQRFLHYCPCSRSVFPRLRQKEPLRLPPALSSEFAAVPEPQGSALGSLPAARPLRARAARGLSARCARRRWD